MTTLSIEPKNTWALLIGVGNFTHDKTLLAIPAVTNNLSKLRQLLANDTIVGIPSEQIVTIENQTDTLQQIIQKLPDHQVETLFVYYVGHGIYDRDQCLYFATPSTLQADLDTALAFASVWKKTSPKATNLIYILDCCWSGKALKTVTPGPEQKISILTATLPNKKALAPEGERYTAFTKHLIELLERGFGKELTLTTAEIRKQLKERLPSAELPSPWGEDRSGTNTEEPLRIAYNRSFSQTGETEVSKKTVFLAEVTDDLVKSRNQVRKFLDQRKDIRILPTSDYDVSSEKLTEDLQQSDLFVQLLSDLPGKRDLVKTQYDCAKTAKIEILQCYSSKLTLAKVQDKAHRQWLKETMVKKMEFNEFTDAIINKLGLPQNPNSQTTSILAAGALVMVNTIEKDSELLAEITSFLDKKEFSYTTIEEPKPFGKISIKVGGRGLQEHHLTCNYQFRVRAPNFTSEDLTLNWVSLSCPTTTP